MLSQPVDGSVGCGRRGAGLATCARILPGIGRMTRPTSLHAPAGRGAEPGSRAVRG